MNVEPVERCGTMPNAEPLNPLNKGSDPVDRVWVEYVRTKFGVELVRHECHLDLGQLTATQSEIELIKYVLVRDEAFRAGQPIIVYWGPLGTAFIVDGHTRARVVWDSGERTIAAILLTSPNVALDMEFAQIAEHEKMQKAAFAKTGGHARGWGQPGLPMDSAVPTGGGRRSIHDGERAPGDPAATQVVVHRDHVAAPLVPRAGLGRGDDDLALHQAAPGAVEDGQAQLQLAATVADVLDEGRWGVERGAGGVAARELGPDDDAAPAGAAGHAGGHERRRPTP